MLKWLMYLLVRILAATYRFRYYGLENIEKAKCLSRGGNYLLAIWHQNLLQGILGQIGRRHVVIVSKSKDAEAVAFACQKMGHDVARGSSRSKAGVDKGGQAAMEEMILILKTGIPGAITVDGPKGPAKKVKPGIIKMAKDAQIAIVPYAPIATKYWEFNSWDKFRLPKPFSIINVYYGVPLLLEEGSEKENLQKDKTIVELAINKACLGEV